MPSRLSRSLPILALLVMLAVPGAAGAPCVVGELGVRGRVLDVTGAPLPCTDVRVVTVGPLGTHAYRVRTAGDGTFSICFACLGPYFAITAQAPECGASAQVMNVPCIDGAGQPNVVDFGDLACTSPARQTAKLISGSVACRSGALLDPVAECSIGITSSTGRTYFTRTDATGYWEECVDCPQNVVTVEAQCCGQSHVLLPFLCSAPVVVPTFVCDPCPVPPCTTATEVEVTGIVTCTDPGGFPEPVVGCAVTVGTFTADLNGDTIPDECAPLVSETVVTDAAGRYTACLPCPLDDCGLGAWAVQASAACCGVSQASIVTGCPPSVELAEMECPGACPNSPPCTPSEGQLTGQVTCTSATGDVQPVPNCEIRITPQGCSVAPFTRFTDANGVYQVCLPCPDCTSVSVTALCCGAAAAAPLDCAGTQLDLSCGACGPASSCAPDQEVFGRLTCIGFPSGALEPLPGVEITVACQGGAGPVQAVTDADGNYSACYPCGTCPVLEVTSDCGSLAFVPNVTCARLEVDLQCGDCLPPQPCPGPPAIEVMGRISCEQGGSPTPLAFCPVVITPRDLLGNPQPDVTTVSDGNGEYVACLPCPPLGMRTVEARGTCCDAMSSTSVIGCPGSAALNTIECTDCSPCPAGMTRLQGRLRCRGGGVVGACGIVITVETCSATLTLTTATDLQGKYELCVPCPCPGSIVRVTAQCCDATRAIQADDCGPVLPVPTLFCTSPCR